MTVAPAGSAQPRGAQLGSCEAVLAQVYDAGLFDLDGVLYVGPDVVPHAAEAVAAARAAGLRTAFVTNNASRRPVEVAAHLRALGIPAQPEEVATSAQAGVRLLREHLPAGATVLVVGSDGLAAEVADGGFTPTRQAGPAVRAVIQGYSAQTAWPDLAEAAIALGAGALWIAANADATLPSPRGPVPGNGALVAALRVATGRDPLVAGKPEPALHLESMARVGAARPLVIGDRLDTDVLGAVRGRADSLLVLTGITDLLAAVSAPAGRRPTYVASDLRGLLAPQPAVSLVEGAVRCEEAAASYDDGCIRVVGTGTPALRAACALGWRSADLGRPVRAVTGLVGSG